MKNSSNLIYKLVLSLLFLYFNSLILHSQKYGAAWIVGYSNDSSRTPKYGKTELNFSTGDLTILYKYGEKLPELGFTNASIATKYGILRYFTDGFRIFNGLQKIIDGGDSLNYNRIWKNFISSGVYPAENNHVFLPMPGNEDEETVLLHFTIDYDPSLTNRYIYAPFFKFSRIVWDSTKNKDVVITKDSIIANGDFIQSHMACTKHANGRDWWIIIEDYLTNTHRIYLLNSMGINLYRNQSVGIQADSLDWTGNSVFSPNGEKFIKYLKGYQIQIYDFDRCTGVLNNGVSINNKIALNWNHCYVAISSNNRFLYLNTDSLIWQYDLLAIDIKASESLIGVWDGYIVGNNLKTSFHQMALAEDGKIYITCRNSNIYLNVINNPNENGLDCNFQLRKIQLPAYMFGNVPQLPNYNLGQLLQSNCDTLLMHVDNTEKIKQDEITIYPNPTSSEIIIHNAGKRFISEANIKVLDLKGTVLYSKEYKTLSQNIIISVNEFSAGMYFIKISDLENNYWLDKFIKL